MCNLSGFHVAILCEIVHIEQKFKVKSEIKRISSKEMCFSFYFSLFPPRRFIRKNRVISFSWNHGLTRSSHVIQKFHLDKLHTRFNLLRQAHFGEKTKELSHLLPNEKKKASMESDFKKCAEKSMQKPSSLTKDCQTSKIRDALGKLFDPSLIACISESDLVSLKKLFEVVSSFSELQPSENEAPYLFVLL